MFLHRFFFFTIPFVLLLLSCNKQQEEPGFDLIIRKDFEISAGLGPFVVHHFYLNNVASPYGATLISQNKTDADISGITNTTGELASIFGDGQLDYIHRISVRVFPEGQPNNYIEVAYRDPTPLSIGTSLGLVPSLANVHDIIKQDRFGIDIAIEMRNGTQEIVPVRLDMKFRVAVK